MTATGNRVYDEIFKNKRAESKAEILQTVSAKLEEGAGRSDSRRNLAGPARFSEGIPDWKIVSTLSRQLAWSHFLEIINLSASGIHIAEYLTALPPRELLAERLHAAVLRARLRLAQPADIAKDIPAAPPAKRKSKGGAR